MTLPVVLTRDFLNFQAARIEQVLSVHRVPARVEGNAVSPRSVRFALQLPFGLKLAAVPKLKEDLAEAVGVDEVGMAEDGDEAVVEVPRPDAEPVRLVDLLDGAGALPPLTACLGLAEDGRPLLLRLTSIGAAHALVAGESGAGKTELLRAMLISLAVRNRQPRLQIGLANPRSRGFAPLAGLPHLIEGVASDPAAARALLERLEWELDRREAEAVSEPHIVLAVDEIMDVVAGGPTAEDLLIRLTRFGRESGVHLLAGTRQPAAAREALPTARFPIRLVGRLKNGADAEAAAGRPGSRAEQLRGRGDFICISGGQAVPFQAAWVPAKDWAGLAAGL